MHIVRSVVATVAMAGATAGFLALGSGPAAAIDVTPLPGPGVQVDLNPSETRASADANIGAIIAGLPLPNAHSFGATLEAATTLASTQPQGRVTFTAFGPITDPSGEIIAWFE